MSEDSEKIAGRAIMSMAQDTDELKAEIERLRGELDALQTHFDIKAKLGAEKDAEIERLRGLVALREKQLDTHINALFKKDAEIERLRSELDACSACAKRADAEIERLRGLLREALTGETHGDWMMRIRETLGE